MSFNQFELKPFLAAFPDAKVEKEYDDPSEDGKDEAIVKGVCFKNKPTIEQLAWIVERCQTGLLSLWEPPSAELLPLVFQFRKLILLGTPKVGTFAVVHDLIWASFPVKELHFHSLLVACTPKHLAALKAILPDLEGISWHQADLCEGCDDHCGDCGECGDRGDMLRSSTTEEASIVFGDCARPW